MWLVDENYPVQKIIRIIKKYIRDLLKFSVLAVDHPIPKSTQSWGFYQVEIWISRMNSFRKKLKKLFGYKSALG